MQINTQEKKLLKISVNNEIKHLQKKINTITKKIKATSKDQEKQELSKKRIITTHHLRSYEELKRRLEGYR